MTLRLALIAVIFIACQAVAQVPDTTRHTATSSVGGVVHDSIARAPLANAMVQLVARDDPAFVRTAISDSLGGYLITDVPVGHYTLGFLHPLLDSLGVDAPLRAIDVANFRPVRIDLAVPSPARLRRAICGAQPTGDSGAVIIGVVRRAGDESGAPQASVTGEWLEFTLARTGFARSIGRRSATTADNGWFALCNVPAGGNVALVASKGADSTGLIEVQVPSDGFLRRDLYLGEGESISSAAEASPDTTRPTRRIHVGNVRLSGTVLSALADRPVANALVFITDGPQTRTNDRGEWTISNAPGGTRTLEVRALGFYPSRSNVNVVSSAPPIRVTLSTLKAVLDTV
ncbi:MAG TPA: carboxypeptidase regulatory-like domain-containing protein, partial [Gemmatimonadaceae bacterium]|nr:carboxypeptidase regulatory-like domain-containing protein [Gemmatimonadaceae bacterium]